LLVQNLNGVAVNVTYHANEVGCANGTGTCSATPSQALAHGTAYGWFVSASNNIGTSPWSNGGNGIQFTTQ